MKKIAVSVLLIAAFVLLICPAYAFADSGKDSGTDGVSAVKETGNQVIEIDGDFKDWKDVPYSYEYNWDNPSETSEWNPQTNKMETVKQTDENGKPYNINVRHKMQLYRDDKNVYLHIIMAKNYYNSLNGYDYEFFCDGQEADFQVVMPGGGAITNSSFGKGIHPVEVRHGNGSISYSVAQGSAAMLERKQSGVNDELELKIPFTEFQRQNPNIDPANIRVLEFFSHNLMYRRIICAGTDTMPFVGVGICAALAGAGCILFYRKRMSLR